MPFRPARLILILAAFGLAGIGSVSSRAEVPPVQAPLQAPHESAISRLRSLVEAAEKAVEAEDWDTASDRADEAEALLSDWSPEVLRRVDISKLVERLRAVLREFEDESEEPTEGVKLAVEEVSLSGAELRAERDQVMAAEQGAVFDFPIDLNDKVLTWVNIFTGRIKSKIEASLGRGSRYLPMIRQIFAEEGIPQDLAFLPIIESGYINSARSRAKAVGMWQFMPATGRIFGLNRSAWVEERRDPMKTTRAAARYLRTLYKDSGDWYLALAGYNNGPGRVESCAQSIGSRNFWDMARSRWMRNATKSYVPQMCAAVLVGRFPERYGLKVVQEAPYVFETVEVDKMTSLTVLARYAGTGVEALKDLNPELLRATTPPGRYALRVPPGTGGATARALTRIPGGERVDFKTYVIRKGDTLAKVAGRFKLSPEDLLTANGITKAKFRPGRKLQVPPPPVVPLDEIGPKLQERARARSEQPLEPLPATPGTPEREAGGLATVPPAPPITEPEIGSPVAVPQVQVIPASPAAAAPKSATAAPKSEAGRPRFHRVKRGETLYSIGVRYDLELGQLRKWNRLKGSHLQVGQNLRLQKP